MSNLRGEFGSLFAVILLLILFVQNAKAAVLPPITLSSGSSGLQSQNFNVPANFASVKIITGGIDDRGSVSINGTQVLFHCSNWAGCAGYGDAGQHRVLGTNPCNDLSLAASFPIDITPYVVVGTNIFSVNVDNCGGGPGGFSHTIEIATVDNPTCTLTSFPTTINLGDSSGLNWTTTNISFPSDTANISDGAGYNFAVSSTPGNTSVSPSSDTTYTLTVTNASSSATCSASVSLAAPSCSLFASPTTINVGGSSTLSWNATNTTSATLEGSPVAVPAGSQTVTPAAPTTYTMNVNGPGGSSSCNTIVNINGPSCTLAASAAVIGTDTTLDWTVSNTNAGTITPGPIALAIPPSTGTATYGPINSATTFTLNVTGPGGNGNCTTIANLITPPPGGIVPCGRMVDNPATSWNDTKPCNFCHLVLVFQLLIEFLVKLGSVAAVFGIAIGGLMHFFSVGDPGRMQEGRKAIRYSLLGFVVIFSAWAIIETILMSLGYIDPLGGKWFEVLCSLP